MPSIATTRDAVEAPVDGRTARATRTRAAVVDALLSLIGEGDLRPTGPRIAARAGVSLRSVFQHFADMEALLTEAAERQTERLQALRRALPHDGPLDGRVAALVAMRSNVFEATAWVRRAAVVQEPFSPTLRRHRDHFYRRGGDEVRAVFAAELGALPAARRRDVGAALDAAASWDTWEHLRARQSLPVPAARRVMSAMLRALLEPARPEIG